MIIMRRTFYGCRHSISIVYTCQAMGAATYSCYVVCANISTAREGLASCTSDLKTLVACVSARLENLHINEGGGRRADMSRHGSVYEARDCVSKQCAVDWSDAHLEFHSTQPPCRDANKARRSSCT
jgi:hypothetical protein